MGPGDDGGIVGKGKEGGAQGRPVGAALVSGMRAADCLAGMRKGQGQDRRQRAGTRAAANIAVDSIVCVT